MESKSLYLFLEEAAEQLCDCDLYLPAFRIRKKYLARRKSPYDRVPIYSRRISEPTQSPYTTLDQLRTLKEQVHRINKVTEQRADIEANMSHKRNFPMPVAFQSYNANLKCKTETVPIESDDVLSGALMKQNEVKPNDFRKAFENTIIPERGFRENYASHLGTSHQTLFMVRGVDNPPASLHASNDRDLVELCDKFTDVMSTKSLSDRKM